VIAALERAIQGCRILLNKPAPCVALKNATSTGVEYEINGFVMAVDFLVVALLINKSLAMFSSLLGTWIPFGLIFVSTYATGMIVNKRRQTRR
jgi:hypothetical protein